MNCFLSLFATFIFKFEGLRLNPNYLAVATRSEEEFGFVFNPNPVSALRTNKSVRRHNLRHISLYIHAVKLIFNLKQNSHTYSGSMGVPLTISTINYHQQLKYSKPRNLVNPPLTVDNYFSADSLCLPHLGV